MPRSGKKSPARSSSAFSLVEVVISVGVIAVTIPVLLGLFGFFSGTSADMVSREEASRAFTAISLFLNGKQIDAQKGTAVTFGAVAGWVDTAQNTMAANGRGQLLYAYKTNLLGTPAAPSSPSQSEYLVSLSPPPAGAVAGKIMVAEIKAAVTTNPPSTVPVTAVMPTASLNASVSGTVSALAKPYVPLEIAIYPVSSAAQATAWASQAVTPTPVDTYPLVVNQ